MPETLVVGAGSWGTAFADYLARWVMPVRIWSREEELFRAISQQRRNPLFLPDVELSKDLTAVPRLEAAAAHSEILVLAVPSKYFRAVLLRLREHIPPRAVLINLSKGFETDSLKTLSQVAEEIMSPAVLDRWLTLSGPSFAVELARSHPTAMVAASVDPGLQKKIQHLFSSQLLRVYRSSDLRGVEVASSLKNVMAIASGLVFGLGFGYNTTASLVTRGSVEIARLGRLMGARPRTFWGLAGMGDLMLTCFSPLSRNFRLGEKIAAGKSLAEAEKETLMVAEGVETCRAAREMSRRFDIEMPITEAVHRVLFEAADPAGVLKKLMTRSLKRE